MTIKKRIRLEKRIILILTIFIIAIYGITFGFKAIQSNRADESQKLVEAALISETPDAISIINEAEPYSLTRTKNGWIYDQNESLRISNAKIIFMITTFKEFSPERIILDGAKQLNEFGLKNPKTIITVESAGYTKKYYIGNYNSALNEYYMTVEGNSSIYLISAENVKLINRTLLELVEDPQIVGITTDNIDVISVAAKETYTISNMGNSFNVKLKDDTFNSSQYRVSNITSAFSAASYSCKYHAATERDLFYCGIERPDAVVDINLYDGTTFNLVVGTGEDGFHYLCENNNKIIYQIDDSYYEKIMDRMLLSSLGYEG